MKMRRRKGQSILEYVIVLTAIIAAIAFVAARMIAPAVQQTGTEMQGTIQGAGTQLPD